MAASFLNYLGRPVLVLLLLLMNGFCLCFVVTRMFDITSDSSKPDAEVVISSFFFFLASARLNGIVTCILFLWYLKQTVWPDHILIQ